MMRSPVAAVAAASEVEAAFMEAARHSAEAAQHSVEAAWLTVEEPFVAAVTPLRVGDMALQDAAMDIAQYPVVP
jgi:hypothetical protein